MHGIRYKRGQYWWMLEEPGTEAELVMVADDWGNPTVSVHSVLNSSENFLVSSESLICPLWLQVGDLVRTGVVHHTVNSVVFVERPRKEYRVVFERTNTQKYLGVEDPYASMKFLIKHAVICLE